MLARTINLYKNAYSGLTQKIWLLSIVMLINRCGTMVLAFMTLYCSHLGFTVQQGGLVVAIYGVGSITGGFVGGKLSDKIGFYYMQVGALLLGGIMFIVLGQMKTYTSICIVTFLLSMVNESFRPANATAIAYYSNAQNRTQSFSLIRLAINLGWGIGSALGGLLASINYHLLFWVDGCTNIVAAVILLFILPFVSKAQQQQTVGVHDEHTKEQTSPFKDTKFLYFLLFKLFFASCFFQIFTTVPIFFKSDLHLSEFDIGLIMSANGVLIALFEMVIVFKLNGKRPYLLLMSYGAVLMSVSFLMLNIPFLNSFLVATMAVLTITVAEMIAMPFMNSFYIERSSQKTRGQYAGMYTMAWSAAQVIGSSTGALFANHFGFVNLWFVVALFCMFAAAGYYWLLGYKSA
ncbi:MFS transporter [Ferruginibacter yonginensis]|uniref:MFS transporter n=1 Tax=Ferruginibacter yonginensis TaxID=1310416 RepID=A0ABV8QVG6_9BACT